jgi:hypothetical protein
MPLELLAIQLNVDSTSSNVYGRSASDSFIVKNIGGNTVFVGHIAPGSEVVQPQVGFPLAPGESVVVPAYDTQATGAVRSCGFNTQSGTSRVAIFDHTVD